MPKALKAAPCKVAEARRMRNNRINADKRERDAHALRELARLHSGAPELESTPDDLREMALNTPCRAKAAGLRDGACARIR